MHCVVGVVLGAHLCAWLPSSCCTDLSGAMLLAILQPFLSSEAFSLSVAFQPSLKVVLEEKKKKPLLVTSAFELNLVKQHLSNISHPLLS